MYEKQINGLKNQLTETSTNFEEYVEKNKQLEQENSILIQKKNVLSTKFAKVKEI